MKEKSNMHANSNGAIRMTSLHSKHPEWELNIQTQLHKQHNDGKCCHFHCICSTKPKTSAQLLQLQRLHSSEEYKTKPIWLTNTPSPVPLLFFPCPCPGDSPSDSSHWSVAATVWWESIWLHPSHPTPHIWFWGVDASGFLNTSEVTGQGMLPDLF